MIDLNSTLKEELSAVERDDFDVVAFTHADKDHISGSTDFFELQHAEKYQGMGSRPKGNFGMCNRPTNPISYLQKLGISSIFRFALTHPDMDHMDGFNAY